MIKVLVVEDSAVVRELLMYILSADPEIQVVGTAKDGEEAVKLAECTKPNIITMDIHMPAMNGFEATRRIMETAPTPIVIVSGSWNSQEVIKTFQAMEAGALAAIERPRGIGDPDHEETARELVRTVKLMAEVKVVKRWARQPRGAIVPATPPAEIELERRPAEVQVVAIGASTGGPLALQKILSALPRGFSTPTLVVQHMAAGFIEGFVEWLGQTSSLPVHVASQGEDILPGQCYVAPDGFQMRVKARGKISLSKDDPENGLRPSVACLFRSVAQFYGQNSVGVLLTGMGKDGAQEMKLMKEKGAITIAQDEESSVVHGMPGEAIHLGAATYVLSPDRIAAALASLARHEKV